MPTQIQDFLRTYMGMAELQQSRNQLDEQKRGAQVAGINTFMTLARQTANPAALTALVDRFSDLGVAPKEQLLSILQNVTPTEEALKASQTQLGINVAGGHGTGNEGADTLSRQTAQATLTGQNAGQLASSEFTAQLLGKKPTGAMADMLAAAAAARTQGTTPGQLVLDHALSMLPSSQLTKGAAANIGAGLTAGQEQQGGQFAQSIGLGRAQLFESKIHNRATEALAETGQIVDMAGVDARRKGAAGVDTASMSGLLSTKSSLVKQLTETKGSPPPGLVISYIGALNAINQQLDAAGVANEGQIPYDPSLLTDPTWLEALKRKFSGTNVGAKAPNSGDMK